MSVWRVPPEEDDDIELVLTDAIPPAPGYDKYAQVVPVADKVVRVGYWDAFGKVWFVDPGSGDEYLYDEDAVDVATNAPTGGGSDTISVVELENNSFAVGDFGTFYRLDIDPVAETAAWDDPAGTTLFSPEVFWDPFTVMAGLDGEHVAVLDASDPEFRPRTWMVDYSNPTPTAHGPFLHGAIWEEGGYGSTFMWIGKLDASRLLCVWEGAANYEQLHRTVSRHRQHLYAQVLTYDTTAHTITPAGRVYRFHQGFVPPFGRRSCHLFAEHGVFVMIGSAPEETADMVHGRSSVTPSPSTPRIVARSLVVDGGTVREGHTRCVVSEAAELSTDQYWEVMSASSADRIGIVYNDGDWGATPVANEMRYAKVRVVLEGSRRGALQVYADDVIVPSEFDRYNMYGHGSPARLTDGNGLALTEVYRDTDTAFMFLLAKGPTS